MIPLEEARRFYAEEVGLAGGVRSQAVVEAFARVPRERYLGPGPWQIPWPPARLGRPWGYRETPDADPRHLCHNVLVAIDRERRLHNGLPSFLAFKIDASGVASGERVVHVGCGVGYYTAILAELVGPQGAVLAVEVDPGLAKRSRENLRHLSHVEVVEANGARHDPGPADVIFVNAGVTHPAPLWLERLREGGRLILPLTHARGEETRGVVLAVRRNGGLAARAISWISVFHCEGARDDEMNRRLGEALQRGGSALGEIHSLRRADHEPGASCWAHLGDVCISFQEPVADRGAPSAP